MSSSPFIKLQMDSFFAEISSCNILWNKTKKQPAHIINTWTSQRATCVSQITTGYNFTNISPLQKQIVSVHLKQF